MFLEIERKFLVLAERWGREGEAVRIVQGYLCREPGRTVRVRVTIEPPSPARGFLTIKSTGFREWEYEIPASEARELLTLATPPASCHPEASVASRGISSVDGLIRKTRWRVEMPDGHIFEVDEFDSGLILAEIELSSLDEPFEKPAWLGREVTGDKRYCNSNM